MRQGGGGGGGVDGGDGGGGGGSGVDGGDGGGGGGGALLPAQFSRYLPPKLKAYSDKQLPVIEAAAARAWTKARATRWVRCGSQGKSPARLQRRLKYVIKRYSAEVWYWQFVIWGRQALLTMLVVMPSLIAKLTLRGASSAGSATATSQDEALGTTPDEFGSGAASFAVNTSSLLCCLLEANGTADGTANGTANSTADGTADDLDALLGSSAMSVGASVGQAFSALLVFFFFYQVRAPS